MVFGVVGGTRMCLLLLPHRKKESLVVQPLNRSMIMWGLVSGGVNSVENLMN